MRHHILTVLMLGLPIAPPVAAQSNWAVRPGERVLVTAPDLGLRRRVGTVRGAQGDTLWLGTRFETIPVDRTDITGLEVYRDPRGARPNYPAIGMVTGFVIGAAQGYARGTPATRLGDAEVQGFLESLVGIAVGATVAAFDSQKAWEPVAPGPARTSLLIAPRMNRTTGVGLTVTF